VTDDSEEVPIPKAGGVRRLHKAFIRYHDPKNWPLLREALKNMGRADLIGNGKHCLIPAWQPLDKTPPRPVQVATRNRPVPVKANKAKAARPARRGR